MSISGLWKKGWLAKTGIILGSLYLLYVLLGAFVLPIIGEKIVEGKVSETMERSITVEDIDFNPFTVSLTVEGLSVDDDLEGTLFYAGLVKTNLQMSTIFTGRLALREFILADAGVSAIMLDKGSWNFDGLLAAGEKAEPVSEEESEPFGFWVGTIDVSNFSIDFEDRNLSSPLKETIGPISFIANDVHNEADAESPYSFDAAIGDSTTIAWSGSLSLNPLASTGKYSIQGMDLAKGKPYWVEMIAIDLQGTLGLSGNYSFSQLPGEEIDFILTNAAVGLANIQVGDESHIDSKLAFSDFSIEGIDANLRTQEVNIASISLNKFVAQALRNASGEFALPQGALFQGSSDASADSEDDSPKSEESDAWKIFVQDFGFRGGELKLLDDSFEGRREVSINSIEIAASSIDLSDDTIELESSLSLKINEAGTLTIDSSGNAPSQRFAGKYFIDALDLKTFQSYIAEYATAELSSGQLSSEGSFEFDTGEITLSTSLELADFQLAKTGEDESLVGIKSFAIDGAQYSAEGSVVEKIEITEPLFRLSQSAKGFNISNLVKGGSESDEVESDEPTSVETPSTDEALPYKIKQFVVSKGNVAFADSTLPDVFQTALRDFDLVVADIDSSPEQRMAVNFEGAIDGGAKNW